MLQIATVRLWFISQQALLDTRKNRVSKHHSRIPRHLSSMKRVHGSFLQIGRPQNQRCLPSKQIILLDGGGGGSQYRARPIFRACIFPCWTIHICFRHIIFCSQVSHQTGSAFPKQERPNSTCFDLPYTTFGLQRNSYWLRVLRFNHVEPPFHGLYSIVSILLSIHPFNSHNTQPLQAPEWYMPRREGRPT